MLTFNLVAYDRMDLCNPVSPEAVGRLLDRAELTPGDRAAELGCGNAALACLLARRGLSVTAIDRGDEMTALARRRVAGEGLEDRVVVLSGEASDLAGDGAPWRLISVMGATALGDFERLVSWLEPGGWLLWGDLYWKGEPTEPVRQVMGNPDLDSDKGWIARGRRAGLRLVESRRSPEAEWVAYVDALSGTAAVWAAENPNHPNREAILKRGEGLSALYGEAGRQFLGFGLYLFRKPA